MDDNPRAFAYEFKHALLKKRVGQIALAIVLGEEILRFITAITWNLIIPLIGRLFEGHTESVLFEGPTQRPIPWDSLAGSVIELAFTIMVVFYLNRWIHKRESHATPATTEPDLAQTPIASDLDELPAEVPESPVYDLAGREVPNDR